MNWQQSKYYLLPSLDIFFWQWRCCPDPFSFSDTNWHVRLHHGRG